MVLTSKHFKIFIAIILAIAALGVVLSIFGEDKNATAEDQYDFAPNFVAIGAYNNGFRYFYDANHGNIVYVRYSLSKYNNGFAPVYKDDHTLLTLEDLLAENP